LHSADSSADAVGNEYILRVAQALSPEGTITWLTTTLHRVLHTRQIEIKTLIRQLTTCLMALQNFIHCKTLIIT